MNADVVVVGAGPAGATAAILLAREGYQVALLDRAIFPRNKPCGEFINPAACDLLEHAFDLSRESLLARGAERVSHIRLHLPRSGFLDIPMIGSDHQAIEGLTMPRILFDRILVDQCRKEHVHIFEEFSARTAQYTDGFALVQGFVRGEPFGFRSRLLVAADGTHSAMARSLGLTRPIPRLSSIGLVAHLGNVDGDAMAQPSTWMFPSRGDGALYGFTRQAQDSAILSAAVPKTFAKEISSDSRQFVRDLISRNDSLQMAAGPGSIKNIQTAPCFGHHLKRTFDEGVLFVGDAAQFVDPFTGEGIHHALESGTLAASVASRALAAQDVSAKALSSYGKARIELSRRYTLCRIVREISVRPWLLGYIGKRIDARPYLAETLVGALVDALPTRTVFNLGFVAGILSPMIGDRSKWSPSTS